MGVYIGVDFHARNQAVCWCDTADGEMQQRNLDHQRDDVRAFYAQFAAPAVVGLEASGYAGWFHQLVEELGHQVRVGNAFALRQFARRRQKNNRRDAELLLELLLRGEFPAVHVPGPASRDVLSLLRYRHRPVRMRTMLKNGLHAVALSHQVWLGPRLFSAAGRKRFQELPLSGASAIQRQHSLVLLDTLQEQIGAIEQQMVARAAADVRVERLRTQPGVGLLTALAVVNRLELVTRFRRSRQVAAYCELDPREHSSGETQRYGHISKQDNHLLRLLLVEAAHGTARARRRAAEVLLPLAGTEELRRGHCGRGPQVGCAVIPDVPGRDRFRRIPAPRSRSAACPSGSESCQRSRTDKMIGPPASALGRGRAQPCSGAVADSDSSLWTVLV